MRNIGWVFRDREDAGERLASELISRGYPKGPTVVLGIPNGGVVVAAPIAHALGTELDMICACTVPHPQWPKTSLGAVTADGIMLLNDLLIAEWGLDSDTLRWAVHRAYHDAQLQATCLRGSRPLPALTGKTVVLVNDALMTGYTMMVAAQSAQAQGAQCVVIAVPTASVQTSWRVRALADGCVCLTRPYATIRDAYRDFDPVPDEVVLRLLVEPREISGVTSIRA